MANFQFFIDYCSHLLRSNSRHGVHSPFVYQLVDKVIYDDSADSDQAVIEKVRSAMLQDQRRIHVTDLGAGSMLNNRKEKRISSIAKNALKPRRVARLLSRLAAEFAPENIIELGTCLGITTAYFAKAAPNAQVTTIEGCPQTATIAAENFKRMQLTGVDLRVGNFDDRLPELLNEISTIGLLYIDGNHVKEATLNYFYMSLAKTDEKSVLIFDDIYWSEGMKEAWEEIKRHPAVSVTVDLFYIGLVFFKKDQQKEDFKIRFF